MAQRQFIRCLSTNVLKIDRKGYVPRRALLYVPGANQKMLNKATKIKVRY